MNLPWKMKNTCPGFSLYLSDSDSELLHFQNLGVTNTSDTAVALGPNEDRKGHMPLKRTEKNFRVPKRTFVSISCYKKYVK